MQKAQRNQNKKQQKAQAKRGKNRAIQPIPVAVSRVRKTRGLVPNIANIKSSPDGRITVTHREYIQEVTPTDAVFQALSLEINPGLKTTFPWLSGLASHYESYLFRSLRFSYEPLLGTSVSGAMILAVDYDAADQIPLTKQTLMAYHRSTRGPIWSPLSCSSDRADLRKFGIQRYVRSHDLTDGLDIKTYDVGQFVFATQGHTPVGQSPIGELYVDYTVELITPHLSDYVPAPNAGTIIPDPATVSVNAPFGDLTSVQTQLLGNISDVIDVPNSTPRQLIFKKIGQFLFERFTRANGLNNSPGMLNPVNGSVLGPQLNAVISGDSTQLLQSNAFEIKKPGQGIMLDNVGQSNLNLARFTLSPFSY